MAAEIVYDWIVERRLPLHIAPRINELLARLEYADPLFRVPVRTKKYSKNLSSWVQQRYEFSMSE